MQFKKICWLVLLLLITAPVFAQRKRQRQSAGFREFTRITNQANLAFNVPDGFKEVSNKQNRLSFDYGIALPGQEFEIWFRVIPEQNDSMTDSLYIDVGKIEAKSLAGDANYFMRGMPPEVISDYNADTGRTFLINLPDSPTTKHYKYALLITLQKKKSGTVMAVCFTNDKGPDFFQNINKARSCMKFRPI
ncbi:hypothetical protein C8P68_101309 [Mucilaginibacter yixingensis]|uniref:DUF4251 domain-containing protein n=1 Tax=Mucilaginibacter yixingensis TaxID=1295612 RepID=A0A2T5JF59_9SPHI|nr:hypothetical protein [Mucilaginibacter yixingensis]PTR01078.1 hypothetical protein C8P68_101309 [Mucilaginibacter yixingensis]